MRALTAAWPALWLGISTTFGGSWTPIEFEGLLYDAKARQVVSINAEPRAPKLATIDWYQKNNGGKLPNSDGLLAGGIPGVVDAWYLLLDRWGTMTFEQVLQPAIQLAEEGFPLSERLARAIAGTRKIRQYPSTMRVYMPSGQPPQAGDILKNVDLARTLRKLVEAEKSAASKGRKDALKAARDRFYKGDIAREMAKFSEENGGLFRYEDFAEYTAKIETPVSIDYRGYRVYKNPSASQGPAELVALNLIEGYDVKKMGLNSPDYIHTSIEAIKLAMADREKYMGDMDFIKIPYDALLSKDYARERRKLIAPERASLDLRPGSPLPKTSDQADRQVHVNLEGESDHEGDTSYLALVDKDRNMVSFEPSLHSGFGTGVVMGQTGLIFNCRGDYYSLTPGENRGFPKRRARRSSRAATSCVSRDPGPRDRTPASSSARMAC